MSRARKRFGQNFLVDPGIISRICRAIAPSPEEHLLEIGPGHGALTGPLLDSGCHLTAVEIDRDLASELTQAFSSLTLITQDVLKLDLDSVFPGQVLRVVGNLPYNISTPLIFRLLASMERIQDMHFMLQKEVVDRMAATESTRDYGRLTVMTQVHCRVEKLFEVPPEAFSPRPAVQSAIVRLSPLDTSLNVDRKILDGILTRAFSARRKTVRNALSGMIEGSDFTALDIDPGLRPENLSVSDYIRCADLLAARG